MSPDSPRDITGLIEAWNGGDENALSSLMSCLYPDLRRLARQHLRHRSPGQTLESAALANEAYLKLVRSGGIRCENRVHFLALCSQMIRRLLLDHARSRGYARHGGDFVKVPLDEAIVAARNRGVEMLALNRALDDLARIDPRKCRLVELRYFGGLSVEEAAGVLGVSVETAKRDWRMAKAWLFGVLSHPSPRDS